MTDPIETNGISVANSDQPNQIEGNAVAYILPFVIFMLLASRSPSIDAQTAADDIAVNNYFYLVIAQVVALVGLVIFFCRQYLKEFPFRVDIWAVIVGTVGVVLWIGICSLNIERQLMQAIGMGDWIPERVGFNPFEKISDPGRRSIFLFFRFTLLAGMVPLVEELFLRGWFVRWWEDNEWHNVKLSSIGTNGIVAVALYGVATHPTEALAAIVWFTLVTVLMIKTGKFWNCVVAHAVTNLLLGLYVVFYEQWHLW